MKALTLTQPWATLVAFRVKTIETRSWSTKYRGPLAIHAAKGIPKGLPRGATFVLGDFEVEHDAAGLLLRGPIAWPYRLPLGAVVATCFLQDVLPVEDVHAPEEEAYGDYSPGRFAWLLEDIVPLTRPITAKGALGLWTWEREKVPA